jgi:hypothetical protein
MNLRSIDSFWTRCASRSERRFASEEQRRDWRIVTHLFSETHLSFRTGRERFRGEPSKVTIMQSLM